MGLKEKRAIENFKEKQLAQLLSSVEGAAGYKVPVNVKWEELAEEGMDHMYNDNLPKVYFEPLVAALSKITVDDLGKKALQGSLKSIVMSNSANRDNWMNIAYADGVLTLDLAPCVNVDDIETRAEAIENILSENL